MAGEKAKFEGAQDENGEDRTPAKTCLVCGGDHGDTGLPCPKMNFT